jgi:CHAT domain-containing protein
LKNALLFGASDEKIPLVEREIRMLAKIFSGAATFTGASATFKNYAENAARFDLLHLACHARFRADNPMFSSLQLADGAVTARDVVEQNLARAALVTLSACETGLNEIYAGEEILGLARGFLSAGAGALLLSLWTIADEAAARLMSDFYENLQRGASNAASLKAAQINFIREGSHPYFWSPFILVGS